MAKVTKELIEQLIVEEIEPLSEEELSELFGGMKRRFGAWKAGRARAAQVKQWEKYKGNLAAKLDQLAGMYQEATDAIAKDLSKAPELQAFANNFTPFKDTFGGIKDHINALKAAAKTVAKTNPEDTPVAGADAEEAGKNASPEGGQNNQQQSQTGNNNQNREQTTQAANTGDNAEDD